MEFDVIRKLNAPTKNSEDLFIETYGKHDTLALTEVLKKYSVDDAFKLLKNLYNSGKIRNIELKIK